MLIVKEATIINRGVIDTSSLPKKFFGRVLVLPRGARVGQWLRLNVEIQLLGSLVTLLPFAIILFLSSELAPPVMEAPALMLAFVSFVKLKVLRQSRSARTRAITADESARRLDILSFRARACLRRIAALHEITGAIASFCRTVRTCPLQPNDAGIGAKRNPRTAPAEA